MLSAVLTLQDFARSSFAPLVAALIATSTGCGGPAAHTTAPVGKTTGGPLRCMTPPEPAERPVAGLTQLRVRRGEAEGVPYLEIIVGQAPLDAPLPMVVGIHGLGDRPRLPDIRYVGFGRPYRIVMPRGPKEWRHGYAWFEVRASDGKPEALAEGLETQAARVAKAVETLTERLPTKGRPVVAGGSQGGMMTFALAVHHPELFAGAVPLMGWLPPSLVPDALERGADYPPIRSLHGTADNVVPLEPTRETVAELKALGLDVELTPVEDVGHYMTQDMERQVQSWLTSMIEAELERIEGGSEAPPRHPGAEGPGSGSDRSSAPN
jgi:phospholipase/carboxylesterase